MYSCKVGTNFKVGFFKRSLNFCYDRVNGIIHTSDLLIFEHLGISKKTIADAYLSETQSQEVSSLKQTCEDLCISNEKNEKIISLLKKQLNVVTDNVKKLENSSKEINECQKDFIEQEEEKIVHQEQTDGVLKNSIGILNKKIKDSNEAIENIAIRFEAIIELISEQINNSKQTVNIMAPNISVEKIWNSMQNKNDAAILAIMYMMKKSLEDKGTRF